MFKRYNIKLVTVRLIFISFVCSVLSGCLSFNLILATDHEAGYRKSDWGSDTITAFSLANDSNGDTGWVFVGEKFDYLLSKGGDNIVTILKDPVILKDKITVKKPTQFIIVPEKKEFSGKIQLHYRWTNNEDRFAILNYGFTCNYTSGICLLLIEDLVGTIHQKDKEQDRTHLMQFYHPFKVEFYQHKPNPFGPKTARVLLPVTLALDIVTSPLQYLYFTTKR